MLKKFVTSRLIFAAAFLGVFLAYGTFFTVAEGEAVVVTRFGAPVRTITEPGPYWRLPAPVDRVQRIDTRRHVLTTPEQSTFTQDKKNVVLTTYVVWHVDDPLEFLQSVRGDVDLATVQLIGKTDNAKNSELGRRDLSSLISLRKEDIAIEEIEGSIQRSVNKDVEILGIRIDQIGIERITFPKENMPAVLDRMQVERLAEAKRLRMEGERRAGEIRNQAHVESQAILRKGREEASRILANSNQEAGRLLADAYGQDEQFYQYWLALQASKKMLGNKPTLIFRSDQAPFNVLTEPPQVAEPSAESGNDDYGAGMPNISKALIESDGEAFAEASP